MTTIKLKYVNSFVDRHGRARAYFRHGGNAWPMPMPEGSPAFIQAYQGYLQRITDPATTPAAPQKVAYLKNSVAWIVERYFTHTEFAGKKPSTQKIYRIHAEVIKRRIGTAPISHLTPMNIRVLRDRIADEQSTSTADMCVVMLRILWDFAGEFLHLDLKANPAREVKKIHSGSEHQPWRGDVVEKFDKTARPNVRLAFALLLYTGQRVGDVAVMRWSDFDGKNISVSQAKINKLGKVPLRQTIPVHPRLLALLKAAPRESTTIVVSDWRRPYSDGESLSTAITRHLETIGAGEFTTHGLRKNAAVNLIEAGCTHDEAKAITGHRSTRMLEHYTKNADQARLAKSGMAKLVKAG
jgi:integrase